MNTSPLRGRSRTKKPVRSNPRRFLYMQKFFLLTETAESLRHLLCKCHLPEGELAEGQERPAWAVTREAIIRPPCKGGWMPEGQTGGFIWQCVLCRQYRSCCGARNSLLAIRFAEFRPLPLAQLPSLLRVGTKHLRHTLFAQTQVPAQPFRSLDSAAGGAPSWPTGGGRIAPPPSFASQMPPPL